jgi:hypothetical protein
MNSRINYFTDTSHESARRKIVQKRRNVVLIQRILRYLTAYRSQLLVYDLRYGIYKCGQTI